jgi:hypothetical protein
MADHDEKEPATAKAPSFLVEVTEVREHAPGDQRFQLTSAASKKIVGATEDMLVAVRNAVTDVCNMAYGAFQAANRPDEVVVKFGVKLGGKAGGGWLVFVTEATGEATLEFEAKWTNPKPGGEAGSGHGGGAV